MKYYGNTEKDKKIQLDFYVKKLGVKTEGEMFVLECILEMEWNRQILLEGIETIRFNAPRNTGLVLVKCRTKDATYHFSVAHLGGKGWTTNSSEEQKQYIRSDIHHKLN